MAKLVWFQRPDGLWNADCTCGASCCGVVFAERGESETRHFQKADEDRTNGHKYGPCGPKFPDENVNMPKRALAEQAMLASGTRASGKEIASP